MKWVAPILFTLTVLLVVVGMTALVTRTWEYRAVYYQDCTSPYEG